MGPQVKSTLSVSPHTSIPDQRQELERSFGKAALQEWNSLAGETDGELYREGILSLASRLEAAGREEAALRVYASLPEEGQAKSRSEAIEGKGNFGQVFESQLRHLASETFRPASILPMLAGSATYSLARGALLGRLLSAPQASFLTRGLAARWTAGAGAFLAEVPVFALSARALSPKRGLAGLDQDLGQAALTLGLLKAFGSAGEWISRRGGLPIQASGQAAIFAGLMTAQSLEAKIGLRPEMGGAAAISHAFSSMLSLGAGARLGQSLLGSRFAAFRHEMEFRAATARPRSEFGTAEPLPSLQIPVALGFGFASSEIPRWSPPVMLSKGGSAAPRQSVQERSRLHLEKLIDHPFLVEAWRVFPEFKELKTKLGPRDFRILAQKLEPRFDDPASNLRVHAFILLGQLVPHLSPAQRGRQLVHLDRGFRDVEPWVREVAIQAFDRNAPFWPREELVKRIPQLRRLASDPEGRVEEAAIRGLVRMTEFLAPAERFGHLREVSEAVLEAGDFDFHKALPTDRALRSLRPEERLKIVLRFERVLNLFGEEILYIPFFGDMISRLEPAHRLGRVQALERLYSHKNDRVRVWAMIAVDNNMDRLPSEARGGRLQHFETLLSDSDPRVRERAVTILGSLYGSEPSLGSRARHLRLEASLRDAEPMVRAASWQAHQRLAQGLRPEGRIELLHRLVGHWAAIRGESRGVAKESLRAIFGDMKLRERQAWSRSLLESRSGRALPPGLAAVFAEPIPAKP